MPSTVETLPETKQTQKNRVNADQMQALPAVI
jgi:hypothetical protein